MALYFAMALIPMNQTESNNTTRRKSILDLLHSLVREILPAVQSDDDIQIPFLEMGANSLSLMEIQRSVENIFGLHIIINQFFEELTTIDVLAAYIDQNLPPVNSDPVSAETDERVTALSQTVPEMTKAASNLDFGEASSELEKILTQQLQAASQAVSQVVSQQLAFLRESGLSTDTLNDASTSAAKNATASSPPLKPPVVSKPAVKKPKAAVSPQHLLTPLEIRARGLTPQQQHHLESLIARYTERTKTSKQLAQRYRSVLADSRASVGFRFTTKEMLYPIVSQRALGSRLWDVDGNEYIDLTMGQGVNLFGHSPSFIKEALEAQSEEVIVPLGSRSPQVGDVAELIAEFTGLERVAFTNSGTEAVMTALRLARAMTGRSKIVFFEHAYHGHANDTMAISQWHNGVLKSKPISAGIPQGIIDEVLVLDYGTDQALELIRAHALELAAVLVEPIQSRRPELQPKAFLHEVRKITRQAGACLIFDEMITGFRLCPGGAQAWFGVTADIAAYGKVIGGGMPIGVIAGKAEYMDGIDGGMWAYGDASYPKTERIVFGGTFCQHPRTMTTALATLKYLKAHSPDLQNNLNQRTARLAETLNACFEQEEVPVKIVHFASVFRFAFSGNLELLYYHLLEKGVFIWEWRNCFLSAAHTDADIEHIIQAVKDSVAEMRTGSFLPPKSVHIETSQPQSAEKSERVETAIRISPQPLLEAQKQLWALAQISEAGSMAYHICSVLQLEGHLRMTALRQAVQQAANRHEALRTVIFENVQQINPPATVETALIDLSKEENSKLRDWIAKENQTPFDLSKDPLFRVHILKLAENKHWLVWTAHHIAVDGLSINIILQELGLFYSCACQKQDCPLEPPLQFRDYVQWQARQSQTPEMAGHEAYWLEQFSDSLPVLDLPADHLPPSVKSYQGNRRTVRLETELCRDIQRLSQKQGCTRFMTFLSAFLILLHRLTGQDDIAVGIPVAGRSLPGGDKLVGYCTHLLPVRSRVTWQDSFTAYLKVIRGVLLKAYQHQDYPFAHLINQLNLRRDGRQSPLVSVTFNLDQAKELPKLSELEVTWMPQPIRFMAFDINANLTETGEDLILHYDYNTDLFDSTTIERWLGHFQTLLKGIVAHPEQAVSELPLLNEAQQHQLLAEWNATKADYPENKCIHQLFEEQTERTPDALAVKFEGQYLSYTALNEKANQLAHYLQTLGVRPEVLAGICIERSLEMVIGILGILKAGGYYLPLDPAYPENRLAFMLEDAGAQVLLTHSNLNKWSEIQNQMVVYLDNDWEMISQHPDENLMSRVQSSHLAYVIYTSGSTGKPKGVMISHQSAVNFLTAMRLRLGLTQQDIFLAITTISFDIAVLELYLPLILGAQVVLIRREAAQDGTLLLETLLESGITAMQATPATWRLLLAANWERMPKLKMFCGGEALPGELAGRLREKGLALWNLYGPTETTVWSAIMELDKNKTQDESFHDLPVLIGSPIMNTQIYILDHNLKPVPIGVLGELHIGGAGLARGYLNRPDLTAEKFIPDPFSEAADARLYKTGDLARYHPNSHIEFLGRIDNQVKIRGFRVESGEIEAVLNQHPLVRETAVIDLESQPDDKRLIAYIVCEFDDSALEDSLQNIQSEHISHWKRIFDENYSQSPADLTFDISGLNSTGLPVPAEEIRVQVNSTVDIILSLQPNRVLEIGCGTGLLLYRVAPHCTQYWGTDFSPNALQQVELLKHQADNLDHVVLFNRTADDFSDIEPESFDTVIINSVIQYFPNVTYFLKVLDKTIKAVKSGGYIFVGDVRSLPLFKTYHASLQFYQAPDSLTRAKLQQRVQQQMAQEKELVIDPTLFFVLKQHNPRITNVIIQPHRGQYHNELTRFRYHVILQIGGGETPEAAGISWIDWPEQQVTLSMVRQQLLETQPEYLGLRHVPNARLETENQIANWLINAAPMETVGQLRQILSKPQSEGIDPDKLWKLSEELPYDVEISWGNAHTEGCYDVLFKAHARFNDQSIACFASQFTTNLSFAAFNLHHESLYANNPLHQKLSRNIVPQLRHRLQTQLPEYMMPSAFVILDAIPLTPNGKVDRHALSSLNAVLQTFQESYAAPQTSTEKILTGIWGEVLGLPKITIGISDNFFEIGGHSLLATQVISKVRETFELELPLPLVFEKTTIAKLAERIDVLRMVAQELQQVTADTSEENEENRVRGRL